jgi:hypothetical protein
MDIFYEIGYSVIVHTFIMMAGILYFRVIEFNRLKEVFFYATHRLPELHFSRYVKLIIRLSIIYIPLLLIAMHEKADKHPRLTGKYEVKRLRINQQLLHQDACADSILTGVYFDIKNGCVFQFYTPAKRWNGTFVKENNHLKINWFSPADKPVFNGTMSNVNGPGKLMLTGILKKATK